MDGSHLPRDTPVNLAVGSRMAVHLLRTGEFTVNTSADATMRHIKGVSAAEDVVLHHLHTVQPALDRRMTHTDIEHALCEWYKYRSIQTGRPAKAGVFA